VPKKSKSPPPISADQTGSEAFATILWHNLEYMLIWKDTARSWEDIEGVHQMRVAVRRMRSALTLFRDAIPREVSRPWGEDMRWIGSQLGRARDLDVFLAEGMTGICNELPLPGGRRLEELAEKRRAEIYEAEVRPMLDSERLEQFCTGLPKWLSARDWEQAALQKKQAKRLHSNIVSYARRILDKQERRVLSAGAYVDRSDASEMHQLRIECKKLRYAAEFFRPIFAGTDEFIEHMKGLQDLLGVMNDVAVTRQLLDDLFDNDGDADVRFYAGAVLGWRTCEFHHLLERFDCCWEELIGAKHPWWKQGSA